MSAVETARPADTSVSSAEVSVRPVTRRIPGAAWLRLLRSELRLVFGRRRNQAGMAVLAAVPLLIAFAVWWTTRQSGPEDGPAFLSQITGNGLFVALTALTAELPLFLPLAIAAISGDTIAGEANTGTLRYLLTVPVSRTRVLTVKFAALTVFTLASVALVLGVGVVIGLLLFGGGPATLLSGTQVSFAEALGRLLLVGLYAAACLLTLGAIGLFVSTLTEQPIGATIAVMVLGVASQILDAVPQLSAIHTYLPTHYWLGFGDLLRDPIGFDSIRPGLLSAAVYIALFTSAAWARFGSKDVTS
jgi:ABC-2 type transport system permease protein